MWGYKHKESGLWYIPLVVLLVSGGLLTGDARATDQAGPVRIAALNPAWGPTEADIALSDNLLDLGYRQNEDFVIGIRFTQGDTAALPAAARDLVQYGVDIIFAATEDAVKAAQMATSRIPIVFSAVGNPVELGLVQSFARPGGNITGVSDLALELGPKRLEVFREIIPSLKRVLFLYDATDVYAKAAAKVYRDAARRLGIVLVEQAVRTEEEAQAVLAQVHKGEVDGILAQRRTALNIFGFVLEAASQRAIPTMCEIAWFTERGGLASYGPDLYETARQAARLVDKILNGTDPAEIPVEVNPKIVFTINLKAANALGLTIAPQVLYQADRIVR